ncbi:putative ECF-type sigma factor negative effector [Paenibacillus agaridevorans]|uniref:Putative ECF-type sigma factor negative effector n=1 Tax=Paenibacillus agaridevorans TaxID=171404 RepID=A0A2R5ERF2_9BACL|nr:DUF3600 domain-containing protein [Paenibacillus agaridevorans]GBG09266.1 putative ECF-type sigma factor negative effector [Paenibacillus agaridevorans]
MGKKYLTYSLLILTVGLLAWGVYSSSDRPNLIYKEKTTINAGEVKTVTHGAVAVSASLHADRIYGSFETVKNYVTETEYLNLSAKFAGWEKGLGNDYPKLEKLMKRMISIGAEHGDNGIVDPINLSNELGLEYKQLLKDMQPYFDQLNKDLS